MTPAIVGTLFDLGFCAIEIPLNSPDAFTSIRLAVEGWGDRALLGAGTVTNAQEVAQLDRIGARLVVAPNADPRVIASASASGMVTMPGVMTPTEALLAWHSGASALKFFPANVLGPAGIGAIRAILPTEAPLAAVGGVGGAEFQAYLTQGLRLFGLGTALYRPGDQAGTVARNAQGLVRAFKMARAG